MNAEDHLIIRRAKHGDLHAFSTLVRNYKIYVYKTAFGILQNNSDAEDVTQETFLKVYQSLRSLRNEETFPTWIARIAVRTALDLVKKNQRIQTYDPQTESSHLIVDEAMPDARMELDFALEKLSPDHRAILVLREIQGWDYEQISRVLEIPIGTVRSRLYHARTQLRQILSESEERHHDV